MSYFLREVISQASVSGPVPSPSVWCRAHGIHVMATSVAFLRNVSVASFLETATWHSPTVFTSFYLKALQISYEGGFGLGPFVASGSIIYFCVAFIVSYVFFSFLYLSVFLFLFTHVFSFFCFLCMRCCYILCLVFTFCVLLYLLKACAVLAHTGSPA